MMYVCMYVYMYMCMYICICACIYVYVHVYMYMCMYMYMYMYMYVYMYMCMCMCILWGLPVINHYIGEAEASNWIGIRINQVNTGWFLLDFPEWIVIIPSV